MDKVDKFARIIFSIAQDGCLDDPDHRQVLKMLIRDSTETTWPHASANFRSQDAARILDKLGIETPGKYHQACRDHLYLDYTVPAGEIPKLITALPDPDRDAIASTLRKFALRSTITPEESGVLRANSCQWSMPASFWDPGSSLFMNPLARYIETGLMIDLVERNATSWLAKE